MRVFELVSDLDVLSRFAALAVASRSLFGALGSLFWTIFALFMLAWSRILRLFVSGRPEVKLLLPL